MRGCHQRGPSGLEKHQTRAVFDIADIDVSIKMSFDIRIDTEKGHIDILKCIIAKDKECSI